MLSLFRLFLRVKPLHPSITVINAQFSRECILNVFKSPGEVIGVHEFATMSRKSYYGWQSYFDVQLPPKQSKVPLLRLFAPVFSHVMLTLIGFANGLNWYWWRCHILINRSYITIEPATATFIENGFNDGI